MQKLFVLCGKIFQKQNRRYISYAINLNNNKKNFAQLFGNTKSFLSYKSTQLVAEIFKIEAFAEKILT